MQKWLLICILLLGSFLTKAQTNASRNNYAGKWALRASWLTNWPGIYAATLTDDVTINGYITRGTASTNSPLTVSGSGTILRISDTLRIHGNFTAGSNAQLYVESGGVVIVEGDYTHDKTVIGYNNGTVIISGSATITGGSSQVTNNGNVYIGGTTNFGSFTTYSTTNELKIANFRLFNFSLGNVIATSCSGANSGALSMSGTVQQIYRWEKSTDNFNTDIQAISNTTGTLTYSNLTETTSFRVFYRDSSGNDVYSFPGTVLIYSEAEGGEVIGNGQVCSGSSVTYSLVNQVGEVLRWEWSTDNFASDTQSEVTDAEMFTLTLTQDLSVRAVLTNGNCSEVTSTEVTTIVDSATVAGTITGPDKICEGTSVTYTLAGQVGNILRWEWSTDNFVSNIQIINSFSSTLVLTPSQSIKVRAAVQSGVCVEELSPQFYTEVISKPVGGTLNGDISACSGSSLTYTLSGYSGTIVRWEKSNDDFTADIQVVSSTGSSYTTTLSETTSLRAVVSASPCNDAVSEVIKTIIDARPIAGSISGQTQVCEGTSVTYTLAGYSGSIIRWEGSTDNFVTDIKTISNTTAQYTITASTDIAVRAVVGNGVCSTVTTAAYATVVDVAPEGGSISGTSVVCADDNNGTLLLENYTGTIVAWQKSTDNFASNIQGIANTTNNLTFYNLTSATYYRAIIDGNSCGDIYSQVFKVDLDAAPVAGIITGPSLVCKASAFNLTLNGYSGNIIRWEVSSDNFVANVQLVTTSQPALSVSEISATRWYRALVSSTTNCANTYTSSFKVDVEEIIIGSFNGNQSICSGAAPLPIQLNGQSGNIIRWESSLDNFVSNSTTINHTQASYQPSGLSATTWYRAVLGGLVCANKITESVKIQVDESPIGGAISGISERCAGTGTVTFMLQAYTGTILRWEISEDNFTADVKVVNETTDQLSLDITSENFWVRAVVANGSCSPAFSQHHYINTKAASVGGTVFGGKNVVSSTNTGSVTLSGHQGLIIGWQSSLDGFTSHVQDIANTTTELVYSNLTQSISYRAIVQNNGCEIAYSLPALIYVNHAPLANADSYTVKVRPYNSINSILANDSDEDGDQLNAQVGIYITSMQGEVEVSADGNFLYYPPEYYLGTDTLVYSVCDGVAGAELCAETIVVFIVSLEAPPIIVYQGISPNKDGYNDYWTIEHIERYPENIVQLYDRYGTLVFEQERYQNSDNHFKGVANRGLQSSGKALPDGTYFYKIKLSPIISIQQGYLIIKSE